MTTWHNIYITDRTGAKFFNTNASAMGTDGEIRTLERHLEGIKSGGALYRNIDVDAGTAVLMLDGFEYGNTQSSALDDIFDELDVLEEADTVDEYVKLTREWFSGNALGSAEEAKSGVVRVNNLQRYIESKNTLSREYLTGQHDHTLAFLQRVHLIRTGKCIALLPM